MATLLYRLGHFATRRRWAVLIVWLALLIGLGGAAAAFSGTMTSSFSIPGTKAQAALDELGEKIPGAGDASGGSSLPLRRARRWPSRTTSRPSPPSSHRPRSCQA